MIWQQFKTSLSHGRRHPAAHASKSTSTESHYKKQETQASDHPALHPLQAHETKQIAGCEREQMRPACQTRNLES